MNERAKPVVGFFICLGLLAAASSSANPTELFISEYIEGSSFNKAVEIYNGTGASIDLAAGGYQLEMYFNGSGSAGTIIALVGTVADGDVHVLADDSADAAILGETDQASAASFFNGDDAVILRKGAAVVDAIGQIGNDPGSEWSGGGIGTQNETLRRKIGLCAGDTDANDAFDPSTPWDGFSNDTFDGLGSHTVQCGALSGWVINEIHAEPDALIGDANGDSTVGAADDEFIELVNNTGGDVNISGWTLADGTTVRHTFPGGTLVRDGCAVLIFGGGTPTGAFGDVVVQTASTGILDLDNHGDTLTFNNGSSDVAVVIYGSEADAEQSITLDPDITGTPPYTLHSAATGSGGSLFSPGTAIDGSDFAGCNVPPAPMVEIFEIQGSGSASPFDGQAVTTENNVVTAVGPEGFFMQTPTARDDADPDTSNGIYVFTGGAPGVSVGDLVDVTAQVDEFFDFTELTGSPFVTVIGTASLPAAVVFNGSVPSPDPSTPSCAIEYECYEGMLIQISNGRVSSPNQTFGSDPLAEVFIVPTAQRAQREPGVEFPGLTPPIPVWDGNPEVFELDPDKLGLANQRIPAGSSFNATGALGFEFGGYELWPSSLSVTPATLPVAVRARQADEMTVGSLNVFRLFDDFDDPVVDDAVVSTAEYDRRRAKFVLYILDVLEAPDILGLQEVEKLEVLQDLAADIQAADASVVYSAFLVEGNDVGGIDVGFLVRDRVTVDSVTQLGAAEILAFDGSLLHDRPPLLLEGRYTAGGANFDLAVMVIHARSLGGIDNPTSGPRVRQKRLEQAQSIAQKAQDFQATHPGTPLVLIGDFNAYEFTDGYVDVIGQICGQVDASQNLVSGPDLVHPNLTNQVLSLPAAERYSFIFRGSAQVLDHALTSTTANPTVQGFAYGRGNADASLDLLQDDTTPLRSSDHDGFVLYLDTDAEVFADGFESGSVSAWTVSVGD